MLETLIEATSIYLIDLTYDYADKRNLIAINDVQTPADSQTFNYTANGFLQTAMGPWSGSAATNVYSLDSGSNRLAGVSTNGTPSRSFVSDDAGNIVEDTDP